MHGEKDNHLIYMYLSVPILVRMHGEKDKHLIYVYLNSRYSFLKRKKELHEARIAYSSMFLYLSRFSAE